MTGYERPADQSLQAIAKRSLYGNEYFNGMGAPVDPHAGMMEWHGQWVPKPAAGGKYDGPYIPDPIPHLAPPGPPGQFKLPQGLGPFDHVPVSQPHVVVDVNIKHDGQKMIAKTSKASPGVTAKIKTATAFGNSGWVNN
jgi:hypothetical protein